MDDNDFQWIRILTPVLLCLLTAISTLTYSGVQDIKKDVDKNTHLIQEHLKDPEIHQPLAAKVALIHETVKHLERR